MLISILRRTFIIKLPHNFQCFINRKPLLNQSHSNLLVNSCAVSMPPAIFFVVFAGFCLVLVPLLFVYAIIYFHSHINTTKFDAAGLKSVPFFCYPSRIPASSFSCSRLLRRSKKDISFTTYSGTLRLPISHIFQAGCLIPSRFETSTCVRPQRARNCFSFSFIMG